LNISLLGPPRILQAGQVVDVPRRRARALLYRLAAGMQPVSREQLALELWPEVPESQARRSLSLLMTHVKHSLPIPQALLASTEHLRLDPALVHSDVPSFSSALSSLADFEQVEAQVNAYRGSFLEGFFLPGCPEFECWQTDQQRLLEHLYRQGLQVLTASLRVHHKYIQAITYAQRCLQLDPLNEQLHRQLIEIFAAAGDRSAALRQYQECARLLSHELGLEPSPETQSIVRLVSGAAVLLPMHLQEDFRLRLPSGRETPLVGRQACLDRMASWMLQAGAGNWLFGLLCGEPGMGKSRLLQAFSLSRRGRVTVLSACCYPGRQALPFQPIADAFHDFLRETPPAFSLPPPLFSEAQRLLPELSLLVPGLPPLSPVDPDHSRLRLYDALCCMLLDLAASRPLLLCLDDLHWADDPTLDWLTYLVHYLERQPRACLLVLLTYNPEEASTLSALRQGLLRHKRLGELVLPELQPGEVQSLVADLLPVSAGNSEIAERLYSVNGGNPFLVIETLRSLLENGVNPSLEAGTLPLPEAISAAILGRVERLEAAPRRLLEACSVFSPDFSLALAARLVQGNEVEILSQVETLVQRGLLSEQHRRYRFKHEIIRRVVYQTILGGRRSLLHRQAAEGLELELPHDPAAISWHYELGGRPDKAARCAFQAGEQARRLLAFEAAAGFYNKAVELLGRQRQEPLTDIQEQESRELWQQVQAASQELGKMAG
jgi:predicted ATPase